MADVDSGACRIVVADSFIIRDRGVVFQPSLPVDAFQHGAKLTLQMTLPDGIQQQVEGRFLVEHLNLGAKGSKWDGVIILDEETGRVPVGTVMVASALAR